MYMFFDWNHGGTFDPILTIELVNFPTQRNIKIQNCNVSNCATSLLFQN